MKVGLLHNEYTNKTLVLDTETGFYDEYVSYVAGRMCENIGILEPNFDIDFICKKLDLGYSRKGLFYYRGWLYDLESVPWGIEIDSTISIFVMGARYRVGTGYGTVRYTATGKVENLNPAPCTMSEFLRRVALC